jgi:3',5'-cyclic AMP phosphodiesterase CpdA
MRQALAALVILALLRPAGSAEARQSDPLPRLPANRAFPGLTAEKEGRWTGPFFFVQLADPQFGFMDAAQERTNAEAAVRHINRLKPRFVVVCGDLVHPPPGTDGYEAKVAEFKSIFSRIDPGIPLLCVPGNHDVGNTPDGASIAAWRKNFGDDYFGFWAGGVRGLVLNSTLYHDPSKSPKDQELQEAWFAQQLTDARKNSPKHVLVFQHHAWFLKGPDDKDGYWAIPQARRKPALALMKDAGVKAIFAGHYHGNVLARDGELEMVITGPVGKPLRKDPSGLRIVEVYPTSIRHAYYPLEEVPPSVVLKE